MLAMEFWITAVFILYHLLSFVETSYVIKVDVSECKGRMDHFWKSTGFCPPLPHNRADLYDRSKDEQLNIAYISSVPHSGIKQVRVHWLLELVTVNFFSGTLQYNFTNLDAFIDLLLKNELQPGFELMGNPSGYFTNFEDKRQVMEWKNLVSLIAKRYIDRYGLGQVDEWNFETWNEPDNHDFDNVSMTVQGFQNYYDACSEGLKEASPRLQLGGPGESIHPLPRSPLSWGLLSHCYNGTNFFTGERGVRLDYIALHKKGGGRSFPILEQEVSTVQQIQKLFPRFAFLPIYNDEADPLVGWSSPQTWRADVTYAAMVTKVIAQHQNLLISNPNNTINYKLLSNDNAFMNYYPHYFTQRTLTARFQMNNTNPPHVQMVRKPVLTVMGLLALLGEKQISADVFADGIPVDYNSTLGVLAALHDRVPFTSPDSWQCTILIYNSNDNRTSFNTDYVTVNVTHVPALKGIVYTTYYLDNKQSNPYLQWKNLGSPVFPSVKQFQQMRNSEDPIREGPTPFPEGGTLNVKVKLPVPSVYLIHICAKPQLAPDQVTQVQLMHLTKGQVAVIWSDGCVNSKCLKTFEVEFSENGKTYARINEKDTIFTLFVFTPDNAIVSGFYRIRAVDYWGMPGLYSRSVHYIEPQD
ncbi:alpha-L-iduronidase [Protopterus annectens]|uniref:alpha-L-iduronidase n=1 Tax=Protopterus annectens TaxID=7888 RepID=UPI001CFAE35A|nr:alpha-L-iduronidase [Protopterus annectens]